MAIEAAGQLADPTRAVEGFVIRNASFHAALNITTESSGVEVNIYIRPRNTTDEKDTGWFDFRVCTFGANGWFENCNGAIQVDYATAPSEIDQGQEARTWVEHHRKTYWDALGACSTLVDPAKLYDHLARCGYGYGPTFQAITSAAWNDSDTIVSKVKTYEWSKFAGGGAAQPHVIHPTTFDGILQTIFGVYTQGGTKRMPTIVPTHIDQLWVSSKGLSHPVAESVSVYARTQWTGVRETESFMSVLDAAGLEVLMEIQGAKTATVSAVELGQDEEDFHVSTCHNVDWKVDLDLLPVEDVQLLCDTEAPLEGESPSYYRDLHFLLTAFIDRALREIKDADVASALESKHHTKMYLNWMKHQMSMVAEGNSPFSGRKYEVLLRDDEYVAQLTAKIASSNKQGFFFTTIGTNLKSLLLGEMDVLSVLFQGTLVEDYYKEVVSISQSDKLYIRLMISLQFGAAPFSKRLGKYLDAYAHKNPDSTILEVGAGTGSTTTQIMKTLTVHGEGEQGAPRYGQYDYTDVSPAFFSSARDKYQSHGDRIRFRTLNIELDPETQGFECGSYDLVVAAAVR